MMINENEIRSAFNDWFKTHSTYLITFEGPRGSGKTKQAKLLADWLSNQVNQPVVYLQSPLRVDLFSSSVYNEMIKGDKTDEEYAILGLLNKQLIQDYIIQHPNTIYIVDRWSLSYWVYQLKVTSLWSNKPFCVWALSFPDKIQPNYQFLLDADYDIIVNRSKKVKEPLHRYESIQFVEKSVNAYHEYAQKVLNNAEYEGNMQVINTSDDTVENTQQIIRDLLIDKLF